MNKDTFETIKINLEARVNACKEHLDHIITTDELRKVTVQEFIDLRAWAKTECAKMTEICMVDLYHIIGMGELTVIQTNLFLKLMKEYMSYRSDLKSINSMASIENLPELPSRSSFTLKQLGNITLSSKIRGRGNDNELVESCSVNDYGQANSFLEGGIKSDDFVFEQDGLKLEGNTLTIHDSQVSNFLKLLGAGAVEEVRKAVKKKKLYCNIAWSRSGWSTETYLGEIKDRGCLIDIRRKLKKSVIA